MIGLVSTIAVSGTGAFFSDSETSTGNTFSAGNIDLKIDNSSYYNGVATSTTSWTLTDLTVEKFFNFFDLKPGDYGEDTVSLHIETNDSYLCANVTLTSNNDNGVNEPEGEDGDVTPGVGEGELAQNVNFMWWADDGDNVLEQGENVISQGPIGSLTLNQPYPFTLADSDQNIWTGVGGPVSGNETLYIGKAWCFGEISSSPLSQSSLGGRATTTPAQDGNGNQTAGEPADGGYLCNGSQLNNLTQTDSLTADVSFTAVQSRNNSGYQCAGQEIRSCELVQTYADSVVSSDQGLMKNGGIIGSDRSDPTYALSTPQSSGAAYDNIVVSNSFFSLGFAQQNKTAEIILAFDNNFVVNGPGNDLKVFEVTGGNNYPDETVDIYVGNSPVGPWTQVGDNIARDAEIDFSTMAPSLTQARYVRIVNAGDPNLFEDTADGYDLDSVQALNCLPRIVQIDQ